MAPVSSMAGGGSFNMSLHSESPVYANFSNFNPNALNSAPNYNANGMGYAPQHYINSQMPVQHPRLQALKEEPQTVPEMPGETPPLSPIDMESQERIKAERNA